MSTTENAVFGDIFVASQLEEAVIYLLKEWYPTYLREVERQMGIPVGKLVPPRVYTNRNDFETIEGDNMPLVVVMSPGLTDEPYTREAGKYTARWNLGVGIAIAAQTETIANLQSRVYAAAARAILMQNQDINGTSIRVDWLDETYDDLPAIENQLQQYRAAGVYFAIEVEYVIDRYLGPAAPYLGVVPDDDPYNSLGQVQDVIIDIGRMPDE
jgi:hypothetical protein